MADLNFPSSPTLYQQYTLNGQTFMWDGARWKFTASSVVTVPSGTAALRINNLTNFEQFLVVGTAGSLFNISSSGSTHVFNIPIAGTGATGLVSTLAQTFTGSKTFDSVTSITNTSASTAVNNGALIVSGGIGIGNTVNLAGSLNLWNPANTYYTSFKSGITTASTVYTLPAYYPSFGQSVLSADTSGNMSWIQMSAVVASAGQGTVSSGAQYQIAGYYQGTGASVSGSATFTNNLATNTVFINHTTSSTGTTTGALVVSGGVGISGQLSYNTALIGNTGVSNPTMTFIGANGDPVKLRVLDDSTLAFSGSQGQLFSISPVLNTGYIFSVNDISGVPLLRANADATVSMAEYAGNVGIGLSNPAYKLQVSGSAGISGTTFISNTTSSTSSSTGALVVTGGVGIGGSLYVSGATNISSVVINSGIIYGTLVGSATSAGFATTANYSISSGYGITSGFATTAGFATTSNYSISAGYAITAGFAVSSTFTTNVILTQDTTNTNRRIIYSTNGVGTTFLFNTDTVYANPSISSVGASIYTGLGYISIRPGLDANSGVSIGNSSGTPYVYFDTINNRVGINTANPLYDLHIIGEISATNKSFVINHPTKPNMSLRYGSLEGPENGVYVRGELKNQTKIYLPEYWTNLVDKDSISVNLTPIGRFSQLYVEKIEDNIVYVADCLMNPVHCYFTVFGERIDIPKLDVEY